MLEESIGVAEAYSSQPCLGGVPCFLTEQAVEMAGAATILFGQDSDFRRLCEMRFHVPKHPFDQTGVGIVSVLDEPMEMRQQASAAPVEFRADRPAGLFGKYPETLDFFGQWAAVDGGERMRVRFELVQALGFESQPDGIHDSLARFAVGESGGDEADVPACDRVGSEAFQMAFASEHCGELPIFVLGGGSRTPGTAKPVHVERRQFTGAATDW